MARVYNFSAGPSMLPLSVLQKAQSELLEYGSSGQSVMEMSHRSSVYEAIIFRIIIKLDSFKAVHPPSLPWFP